jgi:hypothetical protein
MFFSFNFISDQEGWSDVLILILILILILFQTKKAGVIGKRPKIVKGKIGATTKKATK